MLGKEGCVTCPLQEHTVFAQCHLSTPAGRGAGTLSVTSLLFVLSLFVSFLGKNASPRVPSPVLLGDFRSGAL